jgi:hypothetical protein
LFHPIRQWFTKGPITPLFRRFVWADGIPLHSKISVLAYISSYYAIACALALSLLNWVLVGLFNDVLDAFYLTSWNVFLACELNHPVFCPVMRSSTHTTQVSSSFRVFRMSRLPSFNTVSMPTPSATLWLAISK